MFQLTAARRRLAKPPHRSDFRYSFNSQPPEGGWQRPHHKPPQNLEFQLTAARRRLVHLVYSALFQTEFQLTAARRRLDQDRETHVFPNPVSTHSRPKAAGRVWAILPLSPRVSTHSRPKAAGFIRPQTKHHFIVSTHSRPKAAGGS